MFVYFQLRNHNGFLFSKLMIGDDQIDSCWQCNIWALIIGSNLKLFSQIDKVCKELSGWTFALHRFAFLTTRKSWCQFITVSFAVAICGAETKRHKQIFRLQKKAFRLIFGFKRSQLCKGALLSNNLWTFPCLYIFDSLTFLQKKTKKLHFKNPNSFYRFCNQFL